MKTRLKKLLSVFLSIVMLLSITAGLDLSAYANNYYLLWPTVSTTVNSKYGPRNTGIEGASKYHKGIDIQASEGTDVWAAADGVVIAAKTGYNDGRGYYVAIYHESQDLTTLYQHLSSFSVSVGQSVSRGQLIAKAGSTGIGSGAHLHFEMKTGRTTSNSTNFDPLSSFVYYSYDRNDLKPPETPANVRTVSGRTSFSTQESIEFALDAVSNATHYYIYMWKDGTQIYSTNMGNNTRFTAAPSSAGNYTLIVRAGNDIGYSDGRAEVSFVVGDTVPREPANVRTVSGRTSFSTQESIEFAWDAVSNATHYYIYMWKDGTQIYSTNMGNNTRFTAAPSSAGNYTLIVRAGNDIGYSDGRAEVSFVVGDSKPIVPSYIKTIDGKHRYNCADYVYFEWGKAENADKYYLQMFKNGEELYHIDMGNSTQFTASPMTKGSYELVIRAGNSNGYEKTGVRYSFIIYDIYNVSFDANGGNCDVTSKQVDSDSIYGELPIPTKKNYEFIGWFTNLNGGTQITSSSNVQGTKNQTLYAHWKELHTVHSFTNYISNNDEVKATCTKEGRTASKTAKCNYCDFTNTISGTVIPVTDHNVVTDKSVPPTCTRTGLTEGSHCSACNEIIVAQKTINATGHNYKTTTTKATQTADGKIVKKCSTCKHVASTTVIPKASSITISTTKYTYDSYYKKPVVTVKDRKGNKLSTSNYTVTYSNNKYVGKASVKVTLKGNYSGTKTLYFTINPKGTTLSTLSATSKGFKVVWKKQATQTTGYQIQYATNSKFDNAKTVTVTSNSTTSKTISKLTAKKRYYVRVRTYKTVNGTKYYSSWSGYKYVTTKA